MILVMTQVPQFFSRRSLHEQIGLLFQADCAGKAELSSGTQALHRLITLLDVNVLRTL
mgnify:CR=1